MSLLAYRSSVRLINKSRVWSGNSLEAAGVAGQAVGFFLFSRRPVRDGW